MMNVRRSWVLFCNCLSVIFLICECNSKSVCDYANLHRLRGVWPVSNPDHPGIRYEINLCPDNGTVPFSSTKDCAGSVICKFSNGTAQSLGEKVVESSLPTLSQETFSLFYMSEHSGDGEQGNVVIQFHCGTLLGSPEVVVYKEYYVFFIWRTSAACPSTPKLNEVPCYTIDSKGNKFDLTNLVKKTGSYSVLTGDPSMELFINVCADINGDGHSACANNTSACRVINDNAVSVGSLTSNLILSEEGLVLVYEGQKSEDCIRNSQTKIIFRCPAERSGNQPPCLVSNIYCQYEIIWETEFACPEKMLVSDFKTCAFTEKDHGVQIDLSPLKKSSGHYKIPANVNGTEIEFYLNVCGALHDIHCGDKEWKSIAVCANYTKTNTTKVIETLDESELRYADGHIFLTYGKRKCSEDLKHETVISFICNNINDENPKYISSDNCVHYFEWNTVFACTQSSLNSASCVVRKGDRTIDLGRLQKTSGDYPWQVYDVGNSTTTSSSLSYLINVCGNISQLINGNQCDKSAAICMTDGKNKYVNLGRYSSSPVYDTSTDTIILKYTDGDTCDNTNSTWQSSIRFICQPSHQNGPVLVNINEGKCLYEFEWRTAAACPLGIIEGSNCAVKDYSLGIDIDLRSLKSAVYKVKNSTYSSFEFAVCDSLPNPCSLNKTASNISACIYNPKNRTSTTQMIGTMNDRLSYKNGFIYLTYNATLSKKPNRVSEVSIIFLCNKEVGSGKPIFHRKIEDTYEFHWYTDLVCEQEMSINCVARDPRTHEVYDLSSLSKFSHNWKVTFTDEDRNKILYINVCRRLVSRPECDPKASACIVDFDEKTNKTNVINAGQAIDVPVVSSVRYLQLNYSHGSPCVAFGDNTTYRTIIHFLCAPDPSKEQEPRFLGKAGNCHFLFLWQTEAACPTGDLVVHNSCELYDPESGYDFDLSRLARETSPYTLSSKSNTSFELNICSAVKNGCFEKKEVIDPNITVCEADQSSNLTRKLGSLNSYSLTYSKERELFLTYSSINKDSPSVIIQFLCVNGTDEPNMRVIEEDESRIVFAMKTSLACKTVYFPCHFSDAAGNKYDLSPLTSNMRSNYVVADSRPSHQNIRYHLNFCRPLYKLNIQTCPGEAISACQIDISNTIGVFVGLGTQLSPPRVSEPGTIIIQYTNGSDCGNGLKRSTIINLFCSEIEGVLLFVGENADCEFMFSMNTPYACPLQKLKGSECSVTDPAFGYTFDLKPLQNITGVVNVMEYQYSLRVCNTLNNVPENCKDAGACQTKPTSTDFSKNLGLPNSDLIYDKGLLYLKYEGGSGNCHGKYNRSTMITFKCDHNASESTKPSFLVEEDDCFYLFDWPTKYACPPSHVIECSVEDDNGNFYDLSKLSLTNDNYYVDGGNSTSHYIINVCRSVVHSKDSPCPYSSAACLYDSYIEDSSYRGSNLGISTTAPYIENGKLRLKYVTGDPCQTKGSSARFLETVIDFVCDKHNLYGRPEYIGQDECTYYFDFETAYACPITTVESTGDCTVEDPITGYKYNLSSLRLHNSSYAVQSKNHLFNLNVCDKAHGVRCPTDTGMCQQETDGAKRKWDSGKPNGNLQLRDTVLFLNYSNGEPCHGGRYMRSTIIQFQCDANESLTPTFLHETSDCSYFFTWKTKLACQFEVHCALQNGTEHYDMSQLSSPGYVLATSKVKNDDAVYFINICGPLFNIKDIPCPQGASICRVPHNSNVGEDLGSVVLSPFIGFDGHPTSIFNKGSACNSSGYNYARIIFLCDPEALLGEPVLIEINACYYIFEWRTSFVCPSKSTDISVLNKCIFEDVGRGIYFDLSLLHKENSHYEVQEDTKKGTYLLNVCGAVNVTEASSLESCNDASVCFQDKSVNVVDNYGKASTQRFTYDGKRLRLTLTLGDDCPAGENGHRMSEIFFICSSNAGLGKPVVYKKYPCLVVFMWHTNLVCRNVQHQCMFDVDGNIFDLHLLSSITHNWNVTDSKNNNTYFLNLCRGIMQDKETSRCPPSASVCMRDSDGRYMPLGMTSTVTASKPDGTDLLLTYNSQSHKPCEKVKLSPEVNISIINATTRIFMTCGNSLGSPKVLSPPDNRCYYDFSWKTSLVCPNKMKEVLLEDGGILYASNQKFGMDLRNILNGLYIINTTNTREHYSYVINLNGRNLSKMEKFEDCSNAAVCQFKTDGSHYRDIGSVTTRKFYLKGSELHLVLNSLTRPCGKQSMRNVTTVINMQCSTAAKGVPEFLYESGGCDYIFSWETKAVCPNFSLTLDKHTADKVDANKQYSSSHSASIVISLIIISCVVVLIFILSKAERRSAVASKFRGFCSRVSMPRFRYKRMFGESKTINLNMEPKSFYSLNEDDDNLLL